MSIEFLDCLKREQDRKTNHIAGKSTFKLARIWKSKRYILMFL